MEPEKEKWINDVLNSLDGLQRAEPSPFLFAKIQHQLHAVPAPIYVPARGVWLAAASFLLLLLLNCQILHQPVADKQTPPTDLTNFVRDMNLYPTTNQPYDVWSEQNY